MLWFEFAGRQTNAARTSFTLRSMIVGLAHFSLRANNYLICLHAQLSTRLRTDELRILATQPSPLEFLPTNSISEPDGSNRYGSPNSADESSDHSLESPEARIRMP